MLDETRGVGGAATPLAQPVSSGVSGQVQPASSTQAPQAAAGRCSHATRGQRAASRPPTTTKTTNAAWSATVASASRRKLMLNRLLKGPLLARRSWTSALESPAISITLRGDVCPRRLELTPWHADRFGDRGLDRRVGLAALGRGGHAHLECVAEPAGDTVARGARNDLDLEPDVAPSVAVLRAQLEAVTESNGDPVSKEPAHSSSLGADSLLEFRTSQRAFRWMWPSSDSSPRNR